MDNIEHSTSGSEGYAIPAQSPLTDRRLDYVPLDARREILSLRQQLEGVVAERDRLRRLVLRDHAQGHKGHADCPACWKSGVRPNGWRGQ